MINGSCPEQLPLFVGGDQFLLLTAMMEVRWGIQVWISVFAGVEVKHTALSKPQQKYLYITQQDCVFFMFPLQTTPRFRTSWVNLCLTHASPMFICSWQRPQSSPSAKLLKLGQGQGCLPRHRFAGQRSGLWGLDLKADNWRSELLGFCKIKCSKDL